MEGETRQKTATHPVELQTHTRIHKPKFKREPFKNVDKSTFYYYYTVGNAR
jgi:hypothetical protein